MSDEETQDEEAGDFDDVLQLVARADPRPIPGGTVAGRFRILEVAGRGGFGTVYRARDEEKGREVALKVLRGETTDGPRFAREAGVLLTVAHPRVVSYVGHGLTDEGSPYLAMEWLEGIDLARRLAKEALSIDDALTVAACAADGLAAAHVLGVVHRDVKPSNLFLVHARCEDTRLLDFGVARTPLSALTTTGALVGTPAYMAPEQARGARDLSPRVDVFALGCVLFECLTGSTPFAAEADAPAMARLLTEDAPRLLQRRPDAPPALDGLVARMLAREPEGRLADGAAVGVAIAHLRDELSGASPALGATAVHIESFFSTVLVQTAPWQSPPAPIPALARSLGGELLESRAGVTVVRFAHASAAAVAARAAEYATTLREGDPTVRIGIATARGAAAPSAVQAKLAASLHDSEPGDVLLDEASSRYLEKDYEVAHRGSALILGRRRTP